MHFHRENAGLHSFACVDTQAIGTPKVISCQLGFQIEIGILRKLRCLRRPLITMAELRGKSSKATRSA